MTTECDKMFYLFWLWLDLAEPLVDQWYGLLVSNFMDTLSHLTDSMTSGSWPGAWYILYMVMDVRPKLCTVAHLDVILPSGFDGGLGYLSWLWHQSQVVNNIWAAQ